MKQPPEIQVDQTASRSVRVARLATLALYMVGGLGIIWMWPLSGARHLAANVLGSYFLCWGLFLFFSDRKDRLYGPFILVSVTLGLLLLLFETAGVSGLVNYRTLFGNEADGRVVLEEDGIAFPVYRPGSHVVARWPGGATRGYCLPDREPYFSDITYDRYGFRNSAEYETADVAVTGDSFIEGDNVTGDSTVTSRMAALSGERVVNLGISNHGPLEQLGVLKRFGISLKPRAIVWAFYEGNDLKDLGLRWGRSVWSESQPALSDRTFAKNALKAALRLVTECEPSWGNADRRRGVFTLAGGDTTTVYFIDDPRLEALEIRALDKLAWVLREANRVTSEAGIDLVFVYIPMKYRVYRGSLELPLGSDLHDWAPSDLPERVAEVVAAVSPDIAFVDLTPAFTAAAERGELTHLTDDGHWNAKGHSLAAEEILRALP